MNNTAPPTLPDILGCMFVTVMCLLALATFGYAVLFVVTVLKWLVGAPI